MTMMGMGMAMTVVMAVGIGRNHENMLYYNITGVHRSPVKAFRSGGVIRAAGTAATPPRGVVQVKWRTSAKPANRPAIENSTDPST